MVVKPLADRTSTLTVLLRFMLAASITWLFLSVATYIELSFLPASRSLDVVETPFLVATGFFVGVLMLLEIATIVVFFMWVYRATENLRAFTSHDMHQTPGWAVGWYFIPIAWFFKPYQGMRDIWQASHGDDSPHSMVRVWWGVVLASFFAGRLMELGPDGNTVGDFTRAVLFEAPGYVLEIALVFVTMQLVSAVGRAYSAHVTEWSLLHPTVPAGWYPDPSGEAVLRFWTGSEWGKTVRNDDWSQREDDDSEGSSSALP